MSDPIRVEFRACKCSALKEPHHHVDPNTVIPWDKFKESFEKFPGKMGFSISGKAK